MSAEPLNPSAGVIDATQPETVVRDFLRRAEESFTAKNVEAIEKLFLPNGYLRDLLISDWDFASIPKCDLKQFFSDKGVPSINKLMINETKSPPVFVEPTQWIQGFFTFETPIALGEGMVRLQKDPNDQDSWKALTLSLTMDSLKKYPEIAKTARPLGATHGTPPSAKNWLDNRNDQVNFEHDDPQVIIVGAGHSALMLAARLKRLGLRTLILAREKRLGDSWRLRYKTLVLHDHIWADYFPYLKYPDDWPVFIPKDKIANWFESYASIMELNVWTDSSVVPDSTTYDEAIGTWTLQVRRGDGTVRELKSHHIVQATGHSCVFYLNPLLAPKLIVFDRNSGEPNIPKFEGIKDFEGTITHSSAHKGGEGWSGKKAVVVGCCNSGHDIAEEFYAIGADITMVQRSSTLIISCEKGVPLLLEPLYAEGGPATEEADLTIVSFPIAAFEPYLVGLHKIINEVDKDLLQGLKRSGFKLNDDPAGLLIKYWRDGGGYYINVGCSELIIDGKVKIKQGQEIDRFEKKGILFKDGSVLDADIVVLATGYTSMRETCRNIFGPKVADRTGTVWGFDKQSEIQGIWRRSGHPGFWYMGGNLVLSRIYSHFLALQIKAIEEGLAPKL
ncbi:hypothetical protein FRB98_002606 [Tulasnella sp. 332]|nr:hypothetical protein FRB98_002606 [Tulasnella sp. 332]